MDCCLTNQPSSPRQDNPTLIPNSRYSFKSKNVESNMKQSTMHNTPRFASYNGKDMGQHNKSLKQQLSLLKHQEEDLNKFVEKQIIPMENEIKFYEQQVMIRQNQIAQLNGLLQQVIRHKQYTNINIVRPNTNHRQ